MQQLLGKIAARARRKKNNKIVQTKQNKQKEKKAFEFLIQPFGFLSEWVAPGYP